MSRDSVVEILDRIGAIELEVEQVERELKRAKTTSDTHHIEHLMGERYGMIYALDVIKGKKR